ncbi:unnamed protein product, partial [Candidula unifasciata]
ECLVEQESWLEENSTRQPVKEEDLSSSKSLRRSKRQRVSQLVGSCKATPSRKKNQLRQELADAHTKIQKATEMMQQRDKELEVLRLKLSHQEETVKLLKRELEKAELQNDLVQRNYERSQSENEKQKSEILVLQEEIKQIKRKQLDDNYSRQQKIRKLQKVANELHSLHIVTAK